MFPLNLTIEDKKTLTFKGPDQLRKWCIKERENWRSLENVILPYNVNLYSEVRTPLSQIDSALSNFEASPTHPNSQQQLRDAMNNMSSMLAESRYILSDSLLGKHIRSIAKTDPELHAAAFEFAIRPANSNVNFNRRTSLAAGFLAMHHLGVTAGVAKSSVELVESSASAIEQERSEIESLRLQASDRLNEVEQRTGERLDRLFGLIASQISSKRSLYNKSRDETIRDLNRFVKEQVQISRVEIDTFEQFTKDKIALQGPIHYWKTKMKRHRVAAWASGAILVCYSGIIFCFVRSYLNQSYGGLTFFIESWKGASLPAIGILGGISAFFLIVARIIYRIFVSQLHLWNDSAERVTMTETYLALAERGHARDELMGALFARLFSPASDGIVRDDLGSVSPFEAMTKTFGSKSQ